MPREKFFDIVPPREKKREKPAFEINNLKPFFGAGKIPLNNRRLIAFGFSLAILFLFVYFSINTAAKVTLFLETDILKFSTTASLRADEKEVNSENSVIPVLVLTKDKTSAEQFLSTGKELKQEKARGKITVYNGYSALPQLLVATTRFVSADGKLFRTPKTVTIAGAKNVGGKLVPGNGEIEVVADETGEEYNIGSTTFSIPGFVGTPRYTAVYAKSFSSMAGGMSKEVQAVTQQDLDQARSALLKKMIDEGSAELLNGLPEGFILAEKTVILDNIETLSKVAAKEETPSFRLELKGKLKAFALKRSDLNKFVFDFVTSKIPQGKLLKEGSIEVNYSAYDFNFDQGKSKIDLSVLATIYSKIDFQKIKEKIAGQELFSAQRYILENSPEISKVKLKIQPFWIQRLPKFLNKINIEISLNPI
ncbi:MAG: hypothetical protein HYW70_02660 [Candidatus Nealsonbacteria bacterium]|nr:hypothetical protein [Candidatus Nealsonbacteria bacterium]